MRTIVETARQMQEDAREILRPRLVPTLVPNLDAIRESGPDVSVEEDEGGGVWAVHGSGSPLEMPNETPTVQELEDTVNAIEANPASFARQFLAMRAQMNRIANFCQGLPQREEFDALASKVSNLSAWVSI